MKYRITFEIDAKGTSYSIKNKKDEPTAAIMNLGSWFNHLHHYFLERKLNEMAQKHSNPVFQAAIEKHTADDLKLSEQLFNNYTVEGETEDGQKFTFTHKDPGYREAMVWHEAR